MEEKNQNEEMNRINQKLNWEAPKLYCLDKSKTEGGPSYYPPNEDDTYRAS